MLLVEPGKGPSVRISSELIRKLHATPWEQSQLLHWVNSALGIKRVQNTTYTVLFILMVNDFLSSALVRADYWTTYMAEKKLTGNLDLFVGTAQHMD